MGFRRSFAFIVVLAASAPLAMAQPPTSSAKAPASSAAPANSSNAAPGSAPAAAASKADEDAFAKLKAAKTQPGDAKAGQAKAAACGACHGMDGNSTNPEYPKLAGQNPEYIVSQLMRFKSGLRVNAIMQGMAATLSPQDMRNIAAYFSEQKRKPGVADEKLAKTGGTLYREGDASSGIPACMACHGPDGAGNPGWRVPNIGGQHAQYVAQQLKAWHDGTTWGSDTHATIMPMIAKHLTEQDISAVSSYVQGLHAVSEEQSAGQDKVD